jgi:peptidoglycan/LPS O-acetylase OafA/YrhL
MSTAVETSPAAIVSEPPARTRAAVRLHELDGLRGWAALSVVLFHIFWEIFGLVGPGFRNPVTAFFLDGPLAVSIFFVLSGEALSSGFFAGKGEAAVLRLAARRYSRLTLPIAATCAIVFLLVKTGLTFNQEAAAVVHREDWLGAFLHVPATAGFYATYALAMVYAPTKAAQAVDPFLWTMHYEMVGSFLVFGLLLTWRHLPKPLIVLAVLAAAGLAFPATSQLASFLFGILFGALRVDGLFAAIHRRPLAQAASWGLVLVLAVAASQAHMADAPRELLPLYAVPLVFAVFCNKALCDLFASGASRLLGKLSFPLYLVQFPVLVSFTSWAIVFAQAHGGLGPGAIWTIALASLVLCLASAAAFLPVERATRWVGEQVTHRMFASRPSGDPRPRRGSSACGRG